jgi:hypothetical protein
MLDSPCLHQIQGNALGHTADYVEYHHVCKIFLGKALGKGATHLTTADDGYAAVMASS